MRAEGWEKTGMGTPPWLGQTTSPIALQLRAWGGLTLLGLGLLDPPDGLGNLKVIVGRQDLDGRLQLGIVQDLSGDLIGQAAPRGST